MPQILHGCAVESGPVVGPDIQDTWPPASVTRRFCIRTRLFQCRTPSFHPTQWHRSRTIGPVADGIHPCPCRLNVIEYVWNVQHVPRSQRKRAAAKGAAARPPHGRRVCGAISRCTMHSKMPLFHPLGPLAGADRRGTSYRLVQGAASTNGDSQSTRYVVVLQEKTIRVCPISQGLFISAAWLTRVSLSFTLNLTLLLFVVVQQGL